MSKQVVFLALSLPHEVLLWADTAGLSPMREIVEMDPDHFAALCIAVKREANRRERENGFRLPLEEE